METWIYTQEGSMLETDLAPLTQFTEYSGKKEQL